jgi:hypothetical protein
VYGAAPHSWQQGSAKAQKSSIHRTFQTTERHTVRPPIGQRDLPPDGERLQILVANKGMVLAVGREVVVYPELLQVMQECGLFRGVEAAEGGSNWCLVVVDIGRIALKTNLKFFIFKFIAEALGFCFWTAIP